MRPNVLIQRLPSLVALVAIASATGCADERKGPATGSLEGKCFPNGTCNEGLACDSATSLCKAGIPDGVVGGACYSDGTCNPGNACQGDVCVADEGPDTGTLDGPCYGNGTCNSPDLICVASTCEVNSAPHSGLPGGACYDNGTCNPGNKCEGNVCVADATPAGTIGGLCLVNGTCNNGLICNGTTCAVDNGPFVGNAGGPCFPNGTCDAGLECSLQGGATQCIVEVPVELGVEDGPCYDNGTCNGGLVCDLGTCVPSGTEVTEAPGSEDGLCFSNGTCNDGLVCNSFGKCEPIVAGGLNGACLAGGGCNLGLSCQPNGVSGGFACYPTIEHLASIHGVVTDYTTNARLEGVQVTLINQGGVQQTETDALGYYSFDDLYPGDLELTFVSVDGTHTTRRVGHLDTYEARCDFFYNENDFDADQDEHCNKVLDIELFPFTASETGTIWYVNDQEVVPAAGVTVIADYGADGNVTAGSDQETEIDISPDRFTTTTGADGKFTFTNIPNTGDKGVRIFVAPSTFNGVDYESRAYWANLDIFDFDKVEIVLNPSSNPPILVANNWEDFLYGGFDISSPIELTFSRTMKIDGCRIGLNNFTVLGELVWSNGNKTATFTPFAPLQTNTTYHVSIAGCESAIDDQLFEQPCNPGANDFTDGDCFSFRTQEGIDFLTTNADADLDDDNISLRAKGDGIFNADDDITLLFDLEADLTVAGTRLDLVRVIEEYPGVDTLPNDGNDDLEIAVASTSSSAANLVSIDPTDTLVADGHYRVYFKVYSTIVGDFDEGHFDFRVTPEGSLEFLFADIPVTLDNALELLDPAANIVLTFSKDVNLALSTVTLENDDADTSNTGFLVDSVVTADGSTIIINPAADLQTDETYTIRFNVLAADGQGTSVGVLHFTVREAPTTIAFVESNLTPVDGVNFDRSIILDFTAAVDVNDGRNVIVIVDDEGNEDFPNFIVQDTTAIPQDWNNTTGTCGDEVGCVDNGRIRILNPDLKPDTAYTIQFRIYADASEDLDPTSDIATAYVQVAPIPFTTAGHITLLSTTVGTYDGPDENGMFDAGNFTGAGFDGTDGFAVNGAISVTFTEAIDLSKFYPNQYVRLFRDQTGNGYDGSDDLVATVNTVAGALVTLAPLVPLDQSDAGVHYCIRAQVTSALTRIPNNPESDPEIDESEITTLCFVTTTPADVLPSAPTTAPSAFVVNTVFGADQVDYNTTTVPLQWARVTTGVQGTDGDPLYYEIYAKDEFNNDFLLVATVQDHATPALQTYDWQVCSGPLGPLFCTNADGSYSAAPFSNTNTATLRIRACNDAGCGPLNGTPLTVEDKKKPTLSIDQIGTADNTGGTTIRTFDLEVTLNERSNGAAATLTLTGARAGVVCAPLGTTTDTSTPPDVNPGVRSVNGWSEDEMMVTFRCSVPANTDGSTRTPTGTPPVPSALPVIATVIAADDNGNSNLAADAGATFNIEPGPIVIVIP